MSATGRTHLRTLFCENLRRVVEEMDLNYKDVNERTGIYVDHISSILRGISSPSIPDLYGLCAGLEHTPEYLLDFEGFNRPNLFNDQLPGLTKREFGDRLLKAVEAHDKSRAEICSEAGITPSQISQYITGFCYPRLDRFVRLCKALRVTPSYLLGFTEHMSLVGVDGRGQEQ